MPYGTQAMCKDAMLTAGADGKATVTPADINNGSPATDYDGDAVTLSIQVALSLSTSHLLRNTAWTASPNVVLIFAQLNTLN